MLIGDRLPDLLIVNWVAYQHGDRYLKDGFSLFLFSSQYLINFDRAASILCRTTVFYTEVDSEDESYFLASFVED